MPRDLSGNYTLPAGNPVVAGTTIDVAWANPLMTDIAAQLNNVVTRDGKLGLTAQSKAFAGTSSTPSYGFNTPTPANTGLYGDTSGCGLSVAGVQYIACNTGAGVQFGGQKLGNTPSLKQGSYAPVASGFSLVLDVDFLSAWQYFGVSPYGSTSMITVVGEFDVETGGGPTGNFEFDITLPFARLNDAVVGGAGGLISVSGGAVTPEISIVFAKQPSSLSTTKARIIGQTPGGWLSGTGKRYQFSIAFSYKSNVT